MSGQTVAIAQQVPRSVIIRSSGGKNMKKRKVVVGLLGTMCVFGLGGQRATTQENPAPSTAEVHVVITDMAVRSDSEVPRLGQNDVKVKQGKASPRSGARYEYRTGGGAMGKTIRMEPPSPTVLSGDERPWAVRKAAAFLGVSQQTVYLWVEGKKIPHLRVMGRNIRFLRSDLATFRASFKQEVEKY
jgi:excisionase family DNA binding protein